MFSKNINNSKQSIYISTILVKLFGIFLIVIGILILIFPEVLNINIGFSSILIGLYIIVLNFEKPLQESLSNAQINVDILNALKIKNNAIFLPKTTIIDEERILLLKNDKKIQIPNIIDDRVFFTSKDNESLGILIPPSGLRTIKELENQGELTDITIKNLKDYFKLFIGLDLVKSISLQVYKGNLRLEIIKPSGCQFDQNLSKKYPCSVCSAIIILVSRAYDDKIWIRDVLIKDVTITFYLSRLHQKK